LQRKLALGKVGLEQCEQTSLQRIATKAKDSAKLRFQDLYWCLIAKFLKDCWPDLNKNAASGVDTKGFFDNIDHEWLLRMLRERINDETSILPQTTSSALLRAFLSLGDRLCV
jgi:hypothetical protein